MLGSLQTTKRKSFFKFVIILWADQIKIIEQIVLFGTLVIHLMKLYIILI